MLTIAMMVGLSGVEPLTSCLSGTRSNQLSYRPGTCCVEEEARGLIMLTTRRVRDSVAGGLCPETMPPRGATFSPRVVHRPRGLRFRFPRRNSAKNSETGPLPILMRSTSVVNIPPVRAGLYTVLLRKEVIQPQLPLRLPCYDFVPITHPTLDGCLPKGLAHRLQVLPAFMT